MIPLSTYFTILILLSTPIDGGQEEYLREKGYDTSPTRLVDALRDAPRRDDSKLFYSVFLYSEGSATRFMTKEQALLLLQEDGVYNDDQKSILRYYLSKHYLRELSCEEAIALFQGQYNYIFLAPSRTKPMSFAMSSLKHFAEHCGFSFSPYCKKLLLEDAGVFYYSRALRELRDDRAESSYDYVYYVCEMHGASYEFHFDKDFFLSKKADLENSGSVIATKSSILEGVNKEIENSIKTIRVCFDCDSKDPD